LRPEVIYFSITLVLNTFRPDKCTAHTININAQTHTGHHAKCSVPCPVLTDIGTGQ